MELDRAHSLDEAIADDTFGVSNVLKKLSTSVSDRELATAEVLIQSFTESWRLERWLALGTVLVGIAASVVTMLALAGNLPVIRRIVDMAFESQTYFQAAGLIIAFGWLLYAWYNYRRMMHAKTMILKSELVDLWLMSRQSGNP